DSGRQPGRGDRRSDRDRGHRRGDRAAPAQDRRRAGRGGVPDRADQAERPRQAGRPGRRAPAIRRLIEPRRLRALPDDARSDPPLGALGARRCPTRSPALTRSATRPAPSLATIRCPTRRRCTTTLAPTAGHFARYRTTPDPLAAGLARFTPVPDP